MANMMTSCRVVTRAPKFASRSYSHEVLLVARGGDGRLAWASAVELRLDVGLGEREAWRAVLDDTRDSLAVGLASAVTMEVSGLFFLRNWHFGGERGLTSSRESSCQMST